MFAVHGDLAHVKVVYDRSTGKSMGYGFVKFTTNEAAAAATAAINGMAIERKRIKVRRREKEEQPHTPELNSLFRIFFGVIRAHSTLRFCGPIRVEILWARVSFATYCSTHHMHTTAVLKLCAAPPVVRRVSLVSPVAPVV